MESHLDAAWNGTVTGLPTNTVFLVFNCAILISTFLLGLPGNVLVCLVVFKNRSLQTVNNAPLVNLAASDLLKCTVDIPLLLLSVLRERSHSEVSAFWCALQQFTYSLCSCVQLLTLVSISVERFQAIAFPLQTEKTKARIRLWILSIWVCGMILAILSLTLSKHVVFYMMCRRRTQSYLNGGTYLDPFGVYVLVPLWVCCLTLIIIHYVRIFIVVRKHSQKVFDCGIQLKPSLGKQIWSLAVSGPRTVPTEPSSRHPCPPQCAVITVSEASSSCLACNDEDAPGNRNKHPQIIGAVCLLSPTARERGKKRMEGKLAQRFGYIIIAFTLFWAPMVVTLLLQIGRNTGSVLLELETSAVVLTCIPAAVDPLIYTLVTRQFRSEFRKLLSSSPGCLLQRRA